MKKFTALIIFPSLLLLFLNSGKAFAQGNGNEEPIPCSFTDGSCISIGYVAIELRPGNPDLYLLSVDYEINQGGENGCPLISRIRFGPTYQNSGVVEVGDESEIIGSIIIEVVANAFDSPGQDRTLTMTVEYEEPGTRNLTIPLQAPEDFDCGSITPLPVELTSFKGKATASGINLEWKTASELNNSHFDVERSTDGKQYESIGTVQGRGTTSTTSNYSLTDKLPKRGLNYYRLKQVDFDNTTNYSKIIAIKWEAGDAMAVALLPNPCRNGDCNIELTNAANIETLIQLKDMAGRIVFSKKIRSDSHLLQVPMHEFKQLKGLFFLTAASDDQVKHLRIVLE